MEVQQMRSALAVAVTLTLAWSAVAWQRQAAPPLGFRADSARAYLDIERRFLRLPSSDRIRDAHLVYTEKPHVAGSERDRELADWTRDQFRAAGLSDVDITTHEVLLPWPEDVPPNSFSFSAPLRVLRVSAVFFSSPHSRALGQVQEPLDPWFVRER